MADAGSREQGFSSCCGSRERRSRSTDRWRRFPPDGLVGRPPSRAHVNPIGCKASSDFPAPPRPRRSPVPTPGPAAIARSSCSRRPRVTQAAVARWTGPRTHPRVEVGSATAAAAPDNAAVGSGSCAPPPPPLPPPLRRGPSSTRAQPPRVMHPPPCSAPRGPASQWTPPPRGGNGSPKPRSA